jgi:hypothetical protein
MIRGYKFTEVILDEITPQILAGGAWNSTRIETLLTYFYFSWLVPQVGVRCRRRCRVTRARDTA